MSVLMHIAQHSDCSKSHFITLYYTLLRYMRSIYNQVHPYYWCIVFTGLYFARFIFFFPDPLFYLEQKGNELMRYNVQCSVMWKICWRMLKKKPETNWMENIHKHYTIQKCTKREQFFIVWYFRFDFIF